MTTARGSISPTVVSSAYRWPGFRVCWQPPPPDQRAGFEFSARGIHWEALDDDISIGGLLAGHGDLRHASPLASV